SSGSRSPLRSTGSRHTADAAAPDPSLETLRSPQCDREGLAGDVGSVGAVHSPQARSKGLSPLPCPPWNSLNDTLMRDQAAFTARGEPRLHRLSSMTLCQDTVEHPLGALAVGKVA